MGAVLCLANSEVVGPLLDSGMPRVNPRWLGLRVHALYVLKWRCHVSHGYYVKAPRWGGIQYVEHSPVDPPPDNNSYQARGVVFVGIQLNLQSMVVRPCCTETTATRLKLFSKNVSSGKYWVLCTIESGCKCNAAVTCCHSCRFIWRESRGFKCVLCVLQVGEHGASLCWC
jgi:hypothetical protein